MNAGKKTLATTLNKYHTTTTSNTASFDVISTNIAECIEEREAKGRFWLNTGMPTKHPYIFAYGNNKVVACSGIGNVAYVSSNYGRTWNMSKTFTQPSTVPNFFSLCFGKGRFIATTSTGLVYYSTDGLTWNKISDITSSDVKFLNNAFFAVHYSTKNLWYSTSGTTGSWKDTGVQVNPSGQFNNFALFNNKFHVTDPSGVVYVAPDLATWTKAPINYGSSSSLCYTFAQSDTMLIGAGFGYYAYTTDGNTWTTATPPLAYCCGLWYYNDIWLGVFSNSAMNSTSGAKSLYYSTDGITWTLCTSSADLLTDFTSSTGYNCSLSYCDGVFVAVLGIGIFYSYDGLDWK